MPAKLAAYRLVARAAHVLPLPAVAGRAAAGDRWVRWAAGRPGAPLVWFHAASVGEALTAEPVMRRLRAARPGLAIVLTHTSPSLARWPGALAADRRDYAPAENPASMAAAFEALAPSALVFSRADLWPEMLHAAHARHVPVAVIGAAVREGSWRLGWGYRALSRSWHQRIGLLGAVSAADAERWRTLGVPAGAIHVTGDPRHDWVLERPCRLDLVSGLVPWAAAGPLLVAGSVEPEDEAVVLDGFALARKRRPDARLLVAPHLPSPAATERLSRLAHARGVSLAPWSGGAAPAAGALIATELGLLADVYLLGGAAYVGGGFRRRRLHSAIEPAAWGVPLLVGPAPAPEDTEDMVRQGGAVRLPRRQPARALADQCLAWWADERARGNAGLHARRALHQGAAGTSARLLLRLWG
jgi:3-deoxy-D-manno-octulosonic-acid transferase